MKETAMKTWLIRICFSLLLLTLATVQAQEEGGLEEQAPVIESSPPPLFIPQDGNILEALNIGQELSNAFIPGDTLIVNGDTGTIETYDDCPYPVTSAIYKTIQAAVDCAPDLETLFISVISIEPGTYTENVYITKSLRLEGASAATTIVDGDNSDSVFSIFPGYFVFIDSLTITNGSSWVGGGVYIDGSTVSITGSTISGNTATEVGGAIFVVDGTVTLTSSTVVGNTADEDGGGIYSLGGLVTVSNTTITGNAATTAGGAIYSMAGMVALVNSTIAGNSAQVGSNLFGSSNVVATVNSIIANGIGGPNCTGTVISAGHNLSNDTSCSLNQSTDKAGQNPLLDVLAYNGGETQTIALQPGSPAINSGNNTVCSVPPISNLDQRGISRPQGTACDIGAFELVLPTNLIQNGDFSIAGTGSNPPLHWFVFGQPSAPPWSLTGGIFNFYRDVGSSQGVVYQQTNAAIAADGVLQAQFDLGNSSNARKRVLILIHDADFSDSSACTFWLPASAPLQTYQMKLHTTEAWSNATLSIYVSNPPDGLAAVQVDNVSMYELTGETFKGTLCTDPNVPPPPGGADSANLIDNFDFSAPLNPLSPLNDWSYFNQISAQIVGDVAQIYRTGTPRGSLFQEDPTVTNAGVPIEVTFQMGNSHDQRMRVVVLIHKRNFGDLGVCTFWLAPNTPLQTYTLRTVATIDWEDGTALSIYPDTLYTPLPAGYVLVDDVVMRQRPSLDVAGTECYEPGQAVPLAPEVVAPQVIIPTLQPTATPSLIAPIDEAPVLATPSILLPTDEGGMTEGVLGEEVNP
jgi:hypothetical protein